MEGEAKVEMGPGAREHRQGQPWTSASFCLEPGRKRHSRPCLDPAPWEGGFSPPDKETWAAGRELGGLGPREERTRGALESLLPREWVGSSHSVQGPGPETSVQF